MNALEKAKAVIDGFDFNEEHIAKFNESAGTELSSESLKDYLKKWLLYYLIPELTAYDSEEVPYSLYSYTGGVKVNFRKCSVLYRL